MLTFSDARQAFATSFPALYVTVLYLIQMVLVPGYTTLLYDTMMLRHARSIFYDVTIAVSLVHQIRHCRPGSYRLLERDAATASVFCREPFVGCSRIRIIRALLV